VVAVVARNFIAGIPAEQRVVAGIARDVVTAAADAMVGGLDRSQNRLSRDHHVIELALIAEHDVIIGVAREDIARIATQNDVVAVPPSVGKMEAILRMLKLASRVM